MTGQLLTEQELNDWFVEHFRPERYSEAFRVEYLPAYAVGTDGDDFHRWVAGEAEPTWSRKNDVLRVLREETAAGLTTSRVKVMSGQPTDYERYACEWGYALNVGAGERIRVWDLAEQSLPPGVLRRDFWLLGDDRGLLMHYDEHGRFEGASLPGPSELAAMVSTRDRLWSGADDFTEWWAAHPQLRRTRRAA